MDAFANIAPPSTVQVVQKVNISEIVKSYSNRLRGFIRKRVQTTEDADDILQEVFYQLAQTDSMLKPIDQMTGWLFTVARNRITDWYRKKKTEPLPEIATNEDDEMVISQLTDLMFDNGSTPETEYLRSLVWIELDKALADLPAEQRLVFELTEMKGFSFNEIAQQTGEPVNTLISRKRYAILFLRTRLQLLYDDLINF